MSAITRKLQVRTLQLLDGVPGGTRCPCCHHSFDIVVSRKQILNSMRSRMIFLHLQCRVCDCRFRELQPAALRTLVTMGLVCASGTGIWFVLLQGVLR